MSKRFSVILGGSALAALALVVLPSRGQGSESSGPAEPGWNLNCEIARLRQEAARLADEARRIRQVEWPAQLARLNARRAELVAAVQAQTADLRERLAERARGLADELSEQKSVFVESDGDSGWLGVTLAEVTQEKAKELKLPAVRGVLLNEVEADSPAAKAGLKTNDVITEYNSQYVEGTAQFRRMVRETPAGRTVQLTVWRDGRAQIVSVELGSFRDHFDRRARIIGPADFDFHFDMPDLDGGFFASRRPILGIDAEDLSGQLGSYFGAPDGEGILVREVKPGSPAEKAGLKAGDVITKVDGERVRSVSDLREKMREKREKKTVSLSVLRKGAEKALNVEVEQPKPPADRRRIISRRTYL